MERQKKIIDASVIVKWLIDEEGTNRALHYQEFHLNKIYNLIISDITIVEVINALKYNKKSINELLEANSFLWNFQFHIERTNQFILEKAVKLSIKHNLTIYDGIYAALTELHGCELITADEKLSKIPNGKRL